MMVTSFPENVQKKVSESFWAILQVASKRTANNHIFWNKKWWENPFLQFTSSPELKEQVSGFWHALFLDTPQSYFCGVDQALLQLLERENNRFRKGNHKYCYGSKGIHIPLSMTDCIAVQNCIARTFHLNPNFSPHLIEEKIT